MTVYALFLAFVFAVGGIALVMAAHERRKERAKDVPLIEGYSHVARCSCGWEIGADDTDDAADMLALHRAVRPHPDLVDDEWQRLSTLALTDWPPVPAELPRTW